MTHKRVWIAPSPSIAPGKQAKRISAVLEAYQASGAAHRNALLHSAIDLIMYQKTKKTKPTDFNLEFILKSH